MLSVMYLHKQRQKNRTIRSPALNIYLNLTLFLRDHFCNLLSNVSRTAHHRNTTFPHDLHFCLGSIVGTANNCPSMPHSSAGRCSLTCYKSYNRFFTLVFIPSCCFSFHSAANFSYHYNSVGIRIIHKHFKCLSCCGANDRITTNSYCGRNTQSCLGHLVSSFIS